MIIEDRVTDLLYLTEAISSNQHPVFFLDYIDLWDDLDHYPIAIRHLDRVLLTEVVSYHFHLKKLTVSDNIVLVQGAHRAHVFRMTDHLVFTSLIDFFYLVDGYQENIEFEETISFNKSIKRYHITDTINVTQTIGTYIPRTMLGTCFPEASNVFLFDSKITLRRPNLGNAINHNLGRIQNRTRGNELIMFNDFSAPSHKDFVLEFNTIVRAQIDELRFFIRANYGKPVWFTDHMGETFAGIIMSPEFKTIERDDCAYGTSFTFRVFT